MKTYYSIESARDALKTMSDDEMLTLKQCVAHAESLLKYKIDYFRDGGEELELYNLIKKTDCMQDDKNAALLGLELMVGCGGPNTWVNIDNCDNVTVQCFWGQQMEIQLGDIGITLDEVREVYQYLIDR